MGNIGNCHPERVLLTEAKPRLTVVFRGWQLHCYTLVQSIFIILTNTLSTLYGPGWVNICVRILYTVHSNAQIWLIRIYSEAYGHMLCTVDFIFFFGYHPWSSIFTRCQVPSHIGAWFHDSAGDNDFYQMFLSQSESTFLNDSIILTDNSLWVNENLFYWVNARKLLVAKICEFFGVLLASHLS